MKNNKILAVNELVAEFESIKGYFICDGKLCYFIKKEPRNDTLQTVIEKVAAVGSPSLWQNGEQQKVAEYIVSLQIDERLEAGDLDLVTELTGLKVTFSDYELLHFFSRYCCVHQPELFPVYSNSTLRVVQSNYSIPLATGKQFYQDYWKGINLVLNELDIRLPNYFCTEKFFWIYEYQLTSALRENQVATVL